MKIRLLSAGLFLMMGFAPLSAGAVPSCPTAPFPTINIQVLDPQHTLSTSKSLRQINSMANLKGLHQKGKTTHGMTQSLVEASMSAKFTGLKEPRGPVCISLSDLKVQFGHRKLLVHLPREYGRGSCQYNVVLRHEMAHVNVNRGAVRKYAAILNSELRLDIQRSRTLKTTTMMRGKQIFQKRLRAIIKAVMDRHTKEINTLHAKIDAPDSPYLADGKCASW